MGSRVNVMSAVVAYGIAALAGTGCAPVFSDLQSARLAGPGRVEMTPGATTTHFSDDDESGKVQDELGLQGAAGIHDRVDLRVRYVRVRTAEVDDDVAGDSVGVNVVAFGPKVALVKDRLALAIPVGFAFGRDIDSGESWEIHPTLIGTLPIARHIDVVAAGKIIYPFAVEDPETLVAVNLGLGPSDKCVIRPETGVLWNPGGSGHYWHLSLGASYLFGKR
jgi:hypothetical protein